MYHCLVFLVYEYLQHSNTYAEYRVMILDLTEEQFLEMSLLDVTIGYLDEPGPKHVFDLLHKGDEWIAEDLSGQIPSGHYDAAFSFHLMKSA